MCIEGVKYFSSNGYNLVIEAFDIVFQPKKYEI